MSGEKRPVSRDGVVSIDDENDDYDLDSGPDPADIAASAPEDPDADRPVHAVGIGPGNLDFLTPRGEEAIREADVVVGFETVVEFVADRTDADLLTCGYRDELDTLDAFAERVAGGERGTAVAMGDPNHSGYQFVGKVQRAVDRPVRVVPGISSLQIAASRARTPMEDTRFVTLHKSGSLDADLDRLAEAGERHLLVLPRPFDLMPEDIAPSCSLPAATPSYRRWSTSGSPPLTRLGPQRRSATCASSCGFADDPLAEFRA